LEDIACELWNLGQMILQVDLAAYPNTAIVLPKTIMIESDKIISR
jgi:hypothetical protein